uniref:non-specific serine/threonine protein kinase n=1 Tax=Parastrongyloides trichosuri TaxID=131310 RepID=A0A0N4ZMW6_PARTI
MSVVSANQIDDYGGCETAHVPENVSNNVEDVCVNDNSADYYPDISSNVGYISIHSFSESQFEANIFSTLIYSNLPHHYLGDMIGEGGFGKVYEVHSLRSNKKYAAKMVKTKSSFLLEYKLTIKAMLISQEYFCKLYMAYCQSDGAFLVLSLEGRDLKSVMVSLPKKKFSTHTLLRLGLQMLNAIEAFHKTGYVHQDIKLANFVLANGPGNRIKMIDFGIAKKYAHSNGNIIPEDKYLRPKSYVGTLNYCSLRVHDCYHSSPRDDIESWLYCVIQTVDGKLPWHKEGKGDKDIIAKMKRDIRLWSREELKHHKFHAFHKLFAVIDKWSYYDRVDYDYLKTFLKRLMTINKFDYDAKYDWED